MLPLQPPPSPLSYPLPHLSTPHYLWLSLGTVAIIKRERDEKRGMEDSTTVRERKKCQHLWPLPPLSTKSPLCWPILVISLSDQPLCPHGLFNFALDPPPSLPLWLHPPPLLTMNRHEVALDLGWEQRLWWSREMVDRKGKRNGQGSDVLTKSGKQRIKEWEEEKRWGGKEEIKERKKGKIGRERSKT